MYDARELSDRVPLVVATHCGCAQTDDCQDDPDCDYRCNDGLARLSPIAIMATRPVIPAPIPALAHIAWLLPACGDFAGEREPDEPLRTLALGVIAGHPRWATSKRCRRG